MEKMNKNVTLARTSPRIKRSAVNTVRDRVGAEKCATDSSTKEHHINSRKRIKVGQWNVNGLNALGKLSVLSSELDRLNISVCGLSETKWSGTGHSHHWMDTQYCSQAKKDKDGSITELQSGSTEAWLHVCSHTTQ